MGQTLISCMLRPHTTIWATEIMRKKMAPPISGCGVAFSGDKRQVWRKVGVEKSRTRMILGKLIQCSDVSGIQMTGSKCLRVFRSSKPKFKELKRTKYSI
jgi:hypothetical protein